MREVTLAQGRVLQTHYNNDSVVRLHESPKIDIAQA
jgi:hypothetical protein